MRCKRACASNRCANSHSWRRRGRRSIARRCPDPGAGIEGRGVGVLAVRGSRCNGRARTSTCSSPTATRRSPPPNALAGRAMRRLPGSASPNHGSSKPRCCAIPARSAMRSTCTGAWSTTPRSVEGSASTNSCPGRSRSRPCIRRRAASAGSMRLRTRCCTGSPTCRADDRIAWLAVRLPPARRRMRQRRVGILPAPVRRQADRIAVPGRLAGMSRGVRDRHSVRHRDGLARLSAGRAGKLGAVDQGGWTARISRRCRGVRSRAGCGASCSRRGSSCAIATTRKAVRLLRAYAARWWIGIRRGLGGG